MSDDPYDIPDVPDGSRQGGGGDGSGRSSGRRWPWLLAGFALGIAAALLVPRYLTPYLPTPFRPGELQVRGPVLAEQREEDRLLLTVETEQGAILATFRRQVEEIALLVDEGDTVTLGLRQVAPFVEEPTLVGVYKGRPPAGAGAEGGGAGTDTGGARPSEPDTMSQPTGVPDAGDAPTTADTIP